MTTPPGSPEELRRRIGLAWLVAYPLGLGSVSLWWTTFAGSQIMFWVIKLRACTQRIVGSPSGAWC